MCNPRYERMRTRPNFGSSTSKLSSSPSNRFSSAELRVGANNKTQIRSLVVTYNLLFLSFVSQRRGYLKRKKFLLVPPLIVVPHGLPRGRRRAEVQVNIFAVILVLNNTSHQSFANVATAVGIWWITSEILR